MEARELRIGNLVYYRDENLQPKDEVCKVSYMDIGILFNKEKYHHYSPIPLTEDLLLKFGFEKVKSKYEEAETYDYVLQPLYFDMANTSIKINGVYQLVKYPEHVHQLQNLYFALTGEELKII